MTVPSEVTSVERPGNGLAREFSFSPVQIFDETQLEVVVRDASGNLTTIERGTGSTKYSVVATFTENESATGSVRYPESGGTLLPTGSYINIRRVLPLTQTDIDIENQGGYLPEVQEKAFDLMAMRIQQLNEEIGRAVQVPFGSDIDSTEYLATAQEAATAAAASETAAAASALAADASADAAAVSAAEAAAAGYNAAAVAITGGTVNGTTLGATTPAAATATALAATQTLTFSGVISPTQLSANTNNWAPTGLSTATVIRLSTDASRNLTGITAGAAGRTLILANIGSNNLVLMHDATSTSANRLLCPNNADFTLRPNAFAELWYDTTSSRWRVSGVAASASGIFLSRSRTSVNGTGQTTSSTSATDITGHTISVTTTDASQLVKIDASIEIGIATPPAAGNSGFQIRVSRGATTIETFPVAFIQSTTVAGFSTVRVSISCVDSPATAGALTYKLQMLCSSTTATWFIPTQGGSLNNTIDAFVMSA